MPASTRRTQTTPRGRGEVTPPPSHRSACGEEVKGGGHGCGAGLVCMGGDCIAAPGLSDAGAAHVCGRSREADVFNNPCIHECLELSMNTERLNYHEYEYRKAALIMSMSSKRNAIFNSTHVNRLVFMKSSESHAQPLRGCASHASERSTCSLRSRAKSAQARSQWRASVCEARAHASRLSSVGVARPTATRARANCVRRPLLERHPRCARVFVGAPRATGARPHTPGGSRRRGTKGEALGSSVLVKLISSTGPGLHRPCQAPPRQLRMFASVPNAERAGGGGRARADT